MPAEDHVASTLRQIPVHEKPKWAIVKLSAITGSPQAALGARADAPTRTQGDYANVWMRDGEPDCEPAFPEPILEPAALTWAMVSKDALAMKMPIGTTPTELDYRKLGVAHFDVPTETPVRVGEKDVAVWLHDDRDPDGEPMWPEH